MDFARSIVNLLEEKKAENILLLDIHEIAGFTDYFVICSGGSSRTLTSLANSALEKAKFEFGISGKVEGISTAGWLLIDFGDVIVHLFSPEQRDYYRIENLWERGKILLRVQ